MPVGNHAIWQQVKPGTARVEKPKTDRICIEIRQCDMQQSLKHQCQLMTEPMRERRGERESKESRKHHTLAR